MYVVNRRTWYLVSVEEKQDLLPDLQFTSWNGIETANRAFIRTVRIRAVALSVRGINDVLMQLTAVEFELGGETQHPRHGSIQTNRNIRLSLLSLRIEAGDELPSE